MLPGEVRECFSSRPTSELGFKEDMQTRKVAFWALEISNTNAWGLEDMIIEFQGSYTLHVDDSGSEFIKGVKKKRVLKCC